MQKSDTLSRTTCPSAAAIQKELNIKDDTLNNINKINAKLTKARKELKKVQKNATEIRYRHLAQIANVLLARQKGNISAIVKA
eukprot:3657473-Ditylum_brightwellii.AAC.1